MKQQDVDAGIPDQRLDAFQICVLAGERGKARVQWIANDRTDGQKRLQSHARRCRQRRELQPLPCGGIEQHAAEAAGEGDCAQTSSLRQRRVNEILDHFDDRVQVLDPDDARFARDRIEGFHRAGEPPCVGECCFAPVRGRAELHHDDWLARIARGSASGEERCRIVHGFEIGDDDADVRPRREIADVVGGRESCLVARRDHRAGIGAALFERALDRHRDAARLADHRDGSGRDLLRPVVWHGHELGSRIHIAEAIGPRYRETGLRQHELQFERQRASGFVLVEARRHHGRAPRPGIGGIHEDSRHCAGGHEHDEMIWRLGQVGEILVADRVPDQIA